MKKKLSLLMVALVAIAAFAVQVTRRAYSGESPYSYTFSTTEKTFTADGTQTLGGVDWTLAVTWVNDSQKDYNKDSDGGMRIGSSSKSVNAMSLTSAADAFGTNYITSVKIKTAARSGANPKLTVKVGDTDFKYVSGDQKLSAATIGTGKNTEYEFVGVGQGAIAFEWDGSASSSKGAIYVKQIDVAFQAEAPAEPAVAEPVFGLDAGTYAGTQSVEITCKTEGATIYYTTDGTTVPTAESKEYTAPISITETTTIKAIAINGEDKSDVATATYTIVEKINGGTAEKPLTIAKAIELIDTKSDAALSHPDNKVYVKGAFKSYEGDVDSYKQLSYWLTDGTKDFEVYQGKYLENAGFDEDSKAAIDGKLVTVYGNIKKLQSTYEFDRGNYVVKVEEAPVDIEISPASGDIAAALTAACEGKLVGNITINLAADGVYTVSAPIDVPAGLTINGNGATIDGSALTTQMIQMSTTPSVGMNEKDAYLSDGIVVKDVKITGLKYQFIYGNKMKYLLATLSVENSIIAVDGTNKKTIFDFNGGGNASEIIIDKSTIYANPSNEQNGGLFSSQGGHGSIQDLGSDKQLFAITNSTIYNVAYGKTTNSQRRNSTAGMEYKVENSIIVNSGKSGQFIVGLNGGSANSAQTYTISGNVFNFDGGDVSAAEEAKVQEKIADKELKSVAGIVTFADAANGDFNGSFLLAPETTSMPETIGDPRWTLSTVASYAITKTAATNGSYTVKAGDADITEAAEGTEVTITATPDENYELDQIKVEGTSADLEVIVNVEGNVGTFTMPDADVTVIVTFKIATGINSIAADKLKDATIYTIGGQRVNSVKKGLYIINGKKVVIK